MLSQAGFGSWVIANYAFAAEPYAINLAFYARRDERASVELARRALTEFAEQVNQESLRFSEPVRAAFEGVRG